MSTFGDNCPLVLTPRQLRELPSTEVSILDVSWHMPNSPRKAREEFAKERIPGAHYLDLDEVASQHELGLKHMMPTGEVFAEACERLGITPASHVVLYDTHGIFSSPRALFMFRSFNHNRSSILDGGLPAWKAHNCPTESGEPTTIDKSKYPVPTLNEPAIRSYEQVVTNAAFDPREEPIAELVLDARSRGRFLGTDPEPRPGLSSGHLPYAKSLPFNVFLKTNEFKSSEASNSASYTTLRSSEDLHAALENAVGEEYAKEILAGRRGVVASCGSGMTAGVIWLALQMIGVERVGIYDESWTGYAMREESKIEKGE
ncbi:hypothetical protein EW026_g396 [Hermanssonia centrifuga]|uniref:Rhodanese domain-containing protein n=1 Tax=Hermanssonia centrifuga TaxID=98765 RepID=A0A4S4KVS5_9APHY|nr:hypothetical protein EW026_g396 [Hermanssonia centrifuga]